MTHSCTKLILYVSRWASHLVLEKKQRKTKTLIDKYNYELNRARGQAVSSGIFTAEVQVRYEMSL